MFTECQTHIKKSFTELLKHRFIIGCSGGVDSVVLAHICSRMGMDFVLAHCNFQLRGKESTRDSDFVQKLGNEMDIKSFVKDFNTDSYAKTNKLSIQLAARELRYRWFEELAEENDIDYVLTAHQADDALETFLINMSRGTGIRGLAGIP
ncbi:MAG: tRNA lysidine(34) synthetase TilS, partial [Flavobacteriaceae bacterium]